MAGATQMLVTNAANPAKRCSTVVWKAEQVCVVIGSHQVDVTRSAEWLQVTEFPVVICRWFFWLQWYEVTLQLCIVSFFSKRWWISIYTRFTFHKCQIALFTLQIVAVRVFKCPWRRSFRWRAPSLQSPVLNLLMVDLHQPEAGPTWRLLGTYLTAFSFFFGTLLCLRVLSFIRTFTWFQLLWSDQKHFVLKQFLLNLGNIVARLPIINMVIWLFLCSVNLCENPTAVLSFLFSYDCCNSFSGQFTFGCGERWRCHFSAGEKCRNWHCYDMMSALLCAC